MTKEEMLNLKVGDTVIDCKGHKLKVEVFYEERVLYQWIRKIIFNQLIPLVISDTLFNLASDINILTYIHDKHLILDDGSECSAISCCNIID
jgi:hypothetical protein